MLLSIRMSCALRGKSLQFDNMLTRTLHNMERDTGKQGEQDVGRAR